MPRAEVSVQENKTLNVSVLPLYLQKNAQHTDVQYMLAE